MFVLKTFRHLQLPCANVTKLNLRSITSSLQTNNLIVSSVVHQNNSCRLSSTSTSTSQTSSTNQIYFGTLTPKIRAVKVFSLTTSIVGLAAQPMLIEKASSMGSTSIVILICSFVGFFTFITPLVLHFVTRKYVTEINYNPVKDEYTATTLSIFLRKKKTTFQVQDVRVPDIAGMFTTFFVKNTPLFVDVELFTDPSHYVKMMGYDKPIDFHFKVDENDAKRKENQTK